MSADNTPIEDDLPEQLRIRREKRAGLIERGIDSIKGARGIAQVRRDVIETPLAKTIVHSNVPKGTIFHIDYVNKSFTFDMQKPIKRIRSQLS